MPPVVQQLLTQWLFTCVAQIPGELRRVVTKRRKVTRFDAFDLDLSQSEFLGALFDAVRYKELSTMFHLRIECGSGR
jgi:hypothetical protein